MKRITIDFFVGMFVLFGICAIAFLALRVASTSTFGINDKIYTINAKFSNIGSLRVSAPVKVSGFIVGSVVNINLDPKSYQVPLDTRKV